jgi:hypothetical protein
MSFKQKYHWGAYLWSFIHIITISNVNNLEYNTRVKNILELLACIIPCPICAQTYKEHLILLNEKDLSKPMVLFYWSVDLHNLVNYKLNKTQLSYDQALKLWTTTHPIPI